MPQVVRAIVSVVVWVLWALVVLTWTPLVLVVWLATAWWDRRRWYVGRTFRLCAAAALRLNPLWTVEVVGRLPEDRRGPYVVVCNHVSLADVVVVGSLPWETKWVSKVANFRIPFLGLMMRLAGDISVRRRDEESRAEAYERLKAWVERGASVIIFPEGTRSRTGELLPFRNGAFRLALETGTPIVPMAVQGTREAIEKGSPFFGRARARLAILEPVPVEGLGMEDVAGLRDRVREMVRRAREELEEGVSPVSPGPDRCGSTGPDGTGAAP